MNEEQRRERITSLKWERDDLEDRANDIWFEIDRINLELEELGDIPLTTEKEANDNEE